MMVAALNPPTDLSPWWTEEKCHTHQPWPTMAAARRSADLHPVTYVTCRKCSEGMVVEAFRCYSDPSHFHIGHNLPRAEVVPVTPQPIKRGTAPKHSRETARWIYTMRGNTSSLEAARRSGASRRTVRGIWDGTLYAWATEDMRSPQEEPVQITVPPTVIETNGVNTTEILESARAYRRDLQARDLAVEMADALETLLPLAGQSFPKFMLLDVDAIRHLIAQARSLP